MLESPFAGWAKRPGQHVPLNVIQSHVTHLRSTWS
jgi:hypothetical protein